MKSYSVSGQFEQALVKHRFQSARVQANSIPVALRKAMREILKRPGIKGLRHRQFKLVVTRLDTNNPADE